MNGQSPTACVIGGGIIGSWAALHLCEAGVETTLVDQFPLPHDRGSSHGASRAFRLLGDEPLDRLDYSLERWLELERLSGETLFLQTGLLNFGVRGDHYLERYMAVLERAGRRCAWLDAAEIASRFPMLEYPPEWGAAWDPNGGILFADLCLAAVRNQFREAGGRIATAMARSVALSGAGVAVELESEGDSAAGVRDFDYAIVCAGPWTGGLLPSLAPYLRVQSIPVTYWRDPTGAHRADKGFPILFNARLTGVYGLPACESHGHVKVLYHGGPETGPEGTNRQALEPWIEKVGRYVEKHLPLLTCDRPALVEACKYTLTPDNEPILDRLAEGLAVGCGFSGSGFKHAPATGHALCQLALGKADRLPEGFVTGRYALARLSG